MTPNDPRQRYEQERARHEREVRRLQGRERVLGWARLALFAAFAVLLFWALFRAPGSWPVPLVPLAGFLVALAAHDRTIRARRERERAVRFYARGIERLDERWMGTGPSGERFLDPAHPYASDLDLFGHGSLFERVSTARTGPGERTLAAWLCAPASCETIAERQQAVAELRDRLDLRERQAVAGDGLGAGIDFDRLRSWSAAPAELAEPWLPWVSALLAAGNVVGLVLALLGYPLAFVAAALASSAFTGSLHPRVRRVLVAVSGPEQELELLSSILREVESATWQAPRLRALGEALRSAGQPPSRRIAALARLVQIHDSRRNLIFAPLAVLLLAGTQLALAMERWRRASGSAVGRWLDAVGEIEALASFAALSFEHPDDPFPEILAGDARLEARELSHPLIAPARAVANDLVLGPPRLIVVSGSNMSGKSTLLRTVGVNVVLALAGAPVRARRMRLTPLAIGACTRVQDSLQQGYSHFFAEIRRMRQILDLTAGPLPVLFLLDEILHGTNSTDRRAGAELLLRELLERGAIGLVTTHDLALAALAEGDGAEAANVHFGDRLEGDRIVFDFRLRPGVAGRGNALPLMRRVLDLPEREPTG